MKTCDTPDCGRQYIGNHPFCRQCGKRLYAELLCCWCAVEPRDGRSKYCAGCLARIQAIKPDEIGEVPPETPQPRHRGADARERTRDTKRGRDT